MNGHRERYAMLQRNPATGDASLAPVLPLKLKRGRAELELAGLIDTGAAVNVLPWSAGVMLGADWDAAPVIKLAGNLATQEARGLTCELLVGVFAPRPVVFAWSKSDTVPLLLGQMNFLLAFDVLVSRRGGWFEVGDPGAWGS